MKLKRKHIILWLPTLLLCSIGFTAILNSQQPISAVLVTKQTEYEAGDKITLRFTLNTPEKIQLFLHAAFGSTVIESETGDFIIPEFMSNKKGKIDYVVLHDSKALLNGSIQIKANLVTPVQLESYVGPPSIVAGGRDYTMQVVVATDVYDNPLPDSTAMRLKHQFLDTKNEESIYSKDMIGWKNIFSYEKSGRLLISSVVGNTSSKEFSVEVYPSLAQDFQISSQRKHAYADGNQITEFVTSILKDDYGNIVSDGTLVEFKIKDKKGAVLQTQGSTVNGQAIGKILHPDHQDFWEVKAFIPGIAESNTIKLEYESVLDDFKVQFSRNNREILVGPLLSFMDQLIPDGALVKMNIIQNGEILETKVKSSSNGLVTFRLDEGFYPSGTYDFEIKALGVQKQRKQIVLK